MGAVCCGGEASITAVPKSNTANVAQPTQPQPSRSKQYETPQQKGLEFGYQTNFPELYDVGEELGKGQYGTTFVYASCLQTAGALCSVRCSQHSIKSYTWSWHAVVLRNEAVRSLL